jgi:hypothetical protein
MKTAGMVKVIPRILQWTMSRKRFATANNAYMMAAYKQN